PEFALITGMRFGTISFCSYTSADLKFRNRVFSHKVGLIVTNLDVLGVIEDEVMFGNLCDEDSIRLCLILALKVIFMGRLKTRRLADQVIKELNVRVFKLETIIQRLQFNEDLYRLRSDFVESLNILFQDLVDLHDSVEDIANEKRLRLEEEKILRLEEEKMLQIAEHGRRENANWAMVSCYFVQLLMQNIMPLFYANGDKYHIPWSDVDQVFIPINETDQHWRLAHLEILSGLVTFYDSVDTYDYAWRDWDLRTVDDTYEMCQQLHVRCHERREQMLEMQSILHVSTSFAESYKLLEVLQDFVLEKYRDLMKSISETQLMVLKKLSFIAKLHHMLSYKLECEIWGIFYSTPRSSLEEGLTIVEDDFDMNKMYDMGENVGDELGLHDNWLYEGLSLDGPIDVEGQVVLKKKKGRSMVKVTRKRKHQYYKKINGFRKVRGKRVSVEAGKGREMVKAENKRLLGLNKNLVNAEEDIRAKEGYLEILEEAIYWRASNDITLNLLEVYYAKLFNLVLADLEKGVFGFGGNIIWGLTVFRDSGQPTTTETIIVFK
nr:phospholipase-like protein [Tanacetum cinerariifolium]